MYLFIKRIELLDSEHITDENQGKAQNLLKDIDPWDIEFVALSLQTGYPIWTGDKKLVKGLKAKGFRNYILTKDLATKIRQLTK